ncbi:serine protease [Solirubrobacter phytolaccae]|uniref:Serine protease n=1 Tax=Solirubrobacter phytolaccae TaxID=1404360 RepID=A0A9X3NKB4_9ACTN|nr:serine protease [Solirubrobacter phytolaccae]MDA0182952.1 serine protease [Solirubrobacter phytolaccae]
MSDSTAADPLRPELDAIEQLADLLAGDDDARFVVVFQALTNFSTGIRERPEEEAVKLARSVMVRSAEPHLARARATRSAAVGVPRTRAETSDSIYSDPVFLANARRMIGDHQRIVGGIRTSDYPDCVAVGSPGAWCCTGTVVARNVVVTAGHCWAGGCAARVFLGDDVTREAEGRVVKVRHPAPHPKYDPSDPLQDIAVLILEEDLDVAPRPLATAGMIEAAATVRLAGYGNTDVFSSGGYGMRRMVDVPLASTDPRFGADAATEFVAGAAFLDRDSCNGDSGGPAYVQADGAWYLAGATSRATASAIRPCGDGGIYTRVAAYEDWLRNVPGGHWD